ncbi:GbsR/MarR family transcriptional regulator [Mycobacterium sp.]|uniref:GbsR/MarR family transcriptional regulator n=1 Tax=Mycobacterium sp. TaxID=1785 RepID=UPI002CA3FCE5|nr:MarR family transcriptional regulator [Mycobacterium sp.]HME46940.1 MarR family transcriptional regulator [Mycobacterium sp.]
MIDEHYRDAWAQRACDYFTDTFGLAPTTARLLAWLMICEPAEQSGSDLVAALGVSRASVTTSLRLAQAAGLVARHTRPGDRTVYYVIGDDAWHSVLRRRIAAMATFVEIAGDALARMPDDTSTTRIRDARDAFAWLGSLTDAPELQGKPRDSNA